MKSKLLLGSLISLSSLTAVAVPDFLKQSHKLTQTPMVTPPSAQVAEAPQQKDESSILQDIIQQVLSSLTNISCDSNLDGDIDQTISPNSNDPNAPSAFNIQELDFSCALHFSKDINVILFKADGLSKSISDEIPSVSLESKNMVILPNLNYKQAGGGTLDISVCGEGQFDLSGNCILKKGRDGKNYPYSLKFNVSNGANSAIYSLSINSLSLKFAKNPADPSKVPVHATCNAFKKLDDIDNPSKQVRTQLGCSFDGYYDLTKKGIKGHYHFGDAVTKASLK